MSAPPPFCDDCGWQACLQLNLCIEAIASETGQRPGDIELDVLRPLEPSRPLGDAELSDLANGLDRGPCSDCFGAPVAAVPPIDRPQLSMPAGAAKPPRSNPLRQAPTIDGID